MNRIRYATRILMLAGSLTVSMLATAVATPARTDEVLTRQQRGGGVMISLTYLNPLQKAPADKIAFAIRLNTHSVNLDQYDLAHLTTLRNDQGREVQALFLASPMGGGHHRSGVLLFPSHDAAGKPLVGEKTTSLQVILHNVAHQPRWVFQWDLRSGK